MSASSTINNLPLRSAFTIYEVLLTVGIALISFSIFQINISHLVPDTSLRSAVQVLVNDIHQQQSKAMTGDTESRFAPDHYGIYIGSNYYVAFHGLNYLPASPDNSQISLDDISLNTDLPQSKIVFFQNSGLGQSLASAPATITLSQIYSGSTATVIINKYGAVQSFF